MKFTASTIDVHGCRMYLNPADTVISRLLERHKIWEPLETQLIMNQVKEGYRVLDIGANIGYYTLLLARVVGEQGRVFAFEPDPDNFALLQKNVATNGFRNVTLVQKAVGNTTGNLRLYLDDRHKGDHRIYDSNDGRASIPVEAIRLDDYFKDDAGRIDFMKMDIQGSEAGAIQGMHRLLETNRSLRFVTEFWPMGLKRFGVEPQEYLRTLLEHGFNVYRIGDDSNQDGAEYLSFANLFCSRDAWQDHRTWDWERWLRGWRELSEWADRVQLAIRDMTRLIPAGHAFILVDADEFVYPGSAGRRPMPFLERDGQYWGPPPDDVTAIREFERLRQSGASFIVFGWPAFWWLHYYSGLCRYLRARFPCVLANARVIAFDLRSGASAG